MLSPIERLEQWCDRVEKLGDCVLPDSVKHDQERGELIKLAAGCRQIIADWRNLCEKGANAAALVSEASGVCLAIVRLAYIVNPPDAWKDKEDE